MSVRSTLKTSALPRFLVFRITRFIKSKTEPGAAVTAYYNENNRYAAQWLENLIARGLIPYGHVDNRSIADVRPGDLASYTQCHFFAGIGGWAHALRLAGWPDDRQIWTGSCPCQPFSQSGKGLGFDDARDLWPTWFRLISELRPPVVMGEQVAGKAGAVWFARTRDDLETAAYTARGAIVPACAVEAPHRRERLWFVADTDRHGQPAGHPAATSTGRRRPVDADGGPRDPRYSVGNAGSAGLAVGQVEHARSQQPPVERTSGSFWAGAEWRHCADGKHRRLEPGIALLADGVSGDVAGSIAGFGNAIVPQVAAEIIGAYLDIHPNAN